MSKEWEPDDSFLKNKGQVGKNKVRAVHRKYKLSLDKIITSRDLDVDMARHELRREPMPPGWFSWQLPFYLNSDRPTFFFMQTALPGAVLPSHKHDVAQFRFVIAGGLIYKGIELRCGDWIYTPAGASYSLTVATNPGEIAQIGYCY